MSEEARFVSWFKESTGHDPYPFQNDRQLS